MGRNKYGVSMGGHIEDINNINAIECNCADCYWSHKAYGAIYCEYYKKNNPEKTKCKRYSQKEDYGPKQKKRPIKIKDIKNWNPSLPWERP